MPRNTSQCRDDLLPLISYQEFGICYMLVHWLPVEGKSHGLGGRVCVHLVDWIPTNAFWQCMGASSAVLAACLGDEVSAQVYDNPDHHHVRLQKLMTQNNPKRYQIWNVCKSTSTLHGPKPTCPERQGPNCANGLQVSQTSSRAHS